MIVRIHQSSITEYNAEQPFWTQVSKEPIRAIEIDGNFLNIGDACCIIHSVSAFVGGPQFKEPKLIIKRENKQYRYGLISRYFEECFGDYDNLFIPVVV